MSSFANYRSGSDAQRLRLAFKNPWDLCEKLGLLHGRKGRSYQRLSKGVLVRCPAHADHTPSCSVTRGADGSVQVKCFGCDLSGSALDLIAAVEQLAVHGADFVHVLQKAQALCDPTDVHSDVAMTKKVVPLPALDDGVHEQIAAILRAEAPVDRQHDVGTFLRERQVWQLGACAWFALPAAKKEQRGLVEKIVKTVGLDAWMTSGLAHTHPAKTGDWLFAQHRLIIPWYAENGAVDVLQRRTLQDVAKHPDHIGKYILPKGRTPRWPFGWADAREMLQPTTAIAFVEGAMDALSFNALAKTYGLDAVAVGLPGLEGWRRAWAALAKGRVAIVAFDRDRAGDRASHRVHEDLLQAGALWVENRQPKAPAKDWNDAWRTVRH